jgi:hypothetical protein
MSIQLIIDHIKTKIPAITQVVEAGGDNTNPAIDTTKLMNSIITAKIPDTSVFQGLDNPDDLNCVLNLVSSKPIELDRHKITQTDVYIAEIRAKDRTESFQAVADVKSAVEASSYAVEISDWLQDYDKESQSYRQNLELSFTVPASSPSADLPALLIYELGTKAEASKTQNQVRQRFNISYGFVLMTNQSDYSSLKQAILDNVIGYIASNEHEPMQLQQGDPLETEGGLKLYRFVFEHSYIHSEP